MLLIDIMYDTNPVHVAIRIGLLLANSIKDRYSGVDFLIGWKRFDLDRYLLLINMRLTLVIVICLALSDVAFSVSWELVWAPEANKEGVNALEGLEDNGAKKGLPHEGKKHIYVEGNNYRFDMHTVDSDDITKQYKQRTEAKGFNINGNKTYFNKGETWKVTYSMFMPESLKATHSFNSVMQVKQSGGPPLYDMGLIRRNSSDDKEIIRAKMEPGVELMHADLPPPKINGLMMLHSK